MVQGKAWKLEGDYLEGCDCNVVCQCIYGSAPDPGSCRVTIAWHIEKGNYGTTKLDGLNVAAMFHAPGHMGTTKWNAALYLDSRATPAQAEALGAVFGGEAGGVPGGFAKAIGKMVGKRSVPIEFEKKGRTRTLRVPKTIELTLEGMKGVNDKEEVTLHNPPGAAVPGIDPVVAPSVKYSYHDHGYDIELSKKNGYYSRFVYTS